MNRLHLLAVTGALFSTVAMGQTTPPAIPPATTATAATAPPESSAKTSVRDKIMADMHNDGFTDVVVQPGSFIVRAKDKSGTPVTMLIDPDSVTEIVGVGGLIAGSATGNFISVPATDMLTAKVVGTKVNNSTNQDIGTIKDVAYTGTSIKAYIVGVGGFLGIGDHYVAVSPSAISVNYDIASKTWRATMNATVDQLKAAPEFKYPS